MRPELGLGLLVAFGDVARRVDADRPVRPAELAQGLAEELREGRESRWWAADDREHEREAVARRTDHRFRAAADADPDRERPGFEVRHDVLITERRSGRALPADRAASHQLGEEVGLFL